MTVQEFNLEGIAGLQSAQVIQRGLLPKGRHFKRLFDDYFVLYLPQRIISGDFYWVGKKNNLRYLVVGDCTGHGVSAALLSVLAINLFEYSIMNKGIKKPSKILKEVDKKFIESFSHHENGHFDNPWIDLSIVCIDDKAKQMHFAAANRKLLHIRNEQQVDLYKGNRYPIGGWQICEDRRFETQTINFESGDVIYLGSDGFQDQIGGPKEGKYKSKKLHQFISKHSGLPLCFQKEFLETEFLNWKNEQTQLDDVCIVGARL